MRVNALQELRWKRIFLEARDSLRVSLLMKDRYEARKRALANNTLVILKVHKEKEGNDIERDKRVENK